MEEEKGVSVDKIVIPECNSSTCQYHALTESVVRDLKVAVQRTVEGQDQLKETVIHLTEAFKAMDRIDKRMEKLEDSMALKDKEQDQKIDELRIFMYKALGSIATVMAAIGVAGILLI
jgi:hypothetical protein